jgi:hypothetical protein
MSRRGAADERHTVIRAATAVAAVAVIGCLAGCASVAYRPATAGGRPASPSDARAASAPGVPDAGTPAEAEAEARQLLAMPVLPRGASRLPQRPVPSPVSQPGQYLGAGLDMYRIFRLPMSMEAAQHFVRAHLPPVLTSSGSGWGSQDGVPEFETLTAGVRPRAVPPGIDIAQLVYTIAPAADGGSLLRADAQVIVFPARSAAEYLNPAGIRSVTVSTTGPDPVSRTITSRPEIARLARLLDGEHATPLGLVYSCPAELGPSYQLTFTPVSAGRPTVVVDPDNCMGSAVLANGVRQPSLMGTAPYSITKRLLPQPPRILPGMARGSGGAASASP